MVIVSISIQCAPGEQFNVNPFYLGLQTLGGQKIATMVECKDFRKGVIQLEWEQQRIQLQTEHYDMQTRDIQKLHLSKEQQEVNSDGIHKHERYLMFIHY